MEYVVRAVDVGYGNTKYVSSVVGNEIRCASFPSVTYPTVRDPTLNPAFERRKTVVIPIDGMFYEVGPDVDLAADSFRATQMHDQYIHTPDYMALVRGALAMMKVRHIDLLVVGLPVSLFAANKSALERAMAGTHDIGGGKSVVVKKALAVAQPHGALADFVAQHDKGDSIENERSLIIDPGWRTFDWLVARGMRLVLNKSHSLNGGVFKMVRAVAEDISTSIGMPYEDLDTIDLALRTGKNPMVFQKAYDMSSILPMLQTRAQRTVASMVSWFDGAYSFQNVILVGGGAHLFKKAVKQAFPQLRILGIKDPLHSNVRGFQIAGMAYMQRQAATQSMAKDGAQASEGES